MIMGKNVSIIFYISNKKIVHEKVEASSLVFYWKGIQAFESDAHFGLKNG